MARPVVAGDYQHDMLDSIPGEGAGEVETGGQHRTTAVGMNLSLAVVDQPSCAVVRLQRVTGRCPTTKSRPTQPQEHGAGSLMRAPTTHAQEHGQGQMWCMLAGGQYCT